MKWMKTGAVMLALGSLLFTTVAFAAPNLPDNLYRGSKLVGADVENAQGENLGDIKDRLNMDSRELRRHGLFKGTCRALSTCLIEVNGPY